VLGKESLLGALSSTFTALEDDEGALMSHVRRNQRVPAQPLPD
jgi:hypothetical protein